MAQEVLDDFHLDSGGQIDGSGAVAQSVQADRREAGLRGAVIEVVGDVGRVQGVADVGGEEQAGLDPMRPRRETLTTLVDEVGVQTATVSTSSGTSS